MNTKEFNENDHVVYDEDLEMLNKLKQALQEHEPCDEEEEAVQQTQENEVTPEDLITINTLNRDVYHVNIHEVDWHSIFNSIQELEANISHIKDIIFDLTNIATESMLIPCANAATAEIDQYMEGFQIKLRYNHGDKLNPVVDAILRCSDAILVINTFIKYALAYHADELVSDTNSHDCDCDCEICNPSFIDDETDWYEEYAYDDEEYTKYDVISDVDLRTKMRSEGLSIFYVKRTVSDDENILPSMSIIDSFDDDLIISAINNETLRFDEVFVKKNEMSTTQTVYVLAIDADDAKKKALDCFNKNTNTESEK